jgi:hypothetical protein
MSVKPSRGVIHGKTIELVEDLGLTEGQEVDVVVRVRKQRPESEWGQGILNSAGAMAPFWTADDDRILAEIEQDRRQPSTREIPE